MVLQLFVLHTLEHQYFISVGVSLTSKLSASAHHGSGISVPLQSSSSSFQWKLSSSLPFVSLCGPSVKEGSLEAWTL